MIKSELAQQVVDKSPHLHRSDIEKVVSVLEEILTPWCAGTELSYGASVRSP